MRATDELLKKASAGGYAPADYVLAFDVYDDTDESLAMQHLQKAANAGFAPAQWELAGSYQMAVLSLASPKKECNTPKRRSCGQVVLVITLMNLRVI